MSTKRRKKKRPERATEGGSAVMRLAYKLPGGHHDRRKTPRATSKRNAIKEASQ